MTKNIELDYGKEVYRDSHHVVRVKLDPAGNVQVRVHQLDARDEEQRPIGYILGDNMLWFRHYQLNGGR